MNHVLKRLHGLLWLLLPASMALAQTEGDNQLDVTLNMLGHGEARVGGLDLTDGENEEGDDSAYFLMGRSRLAIDYKRPGLETKIIAQHSGIWGEKGKGSFNLYEAWVKLNAKNGWKHVFTGMPRLKDGKSIVYTVTEDPVPWYRTEIYGYYIRNIYEPETTKVTVRKAWKDKDDAAGMRPLSIYMTLSNGMTVVLNKDNNWTATIDNLPTMLNGKPVVYTWKEQEVVGYQLVSVVKDGLVTTFTNRRPVTPKGDGKDDPKTPGDDWDVFDDYGTPLGGQQLINHVGDCFD